MLPSDTLDVLCPLHLQIAPDGTVRHLGPTLIKLQEGAGAQGRPFSDVFEVFRPRRVRDLSGLLGLAGRKLQLRLHSGQGMTLRGLVMPDDTGGAILNLSFGIGVVDAVHQHSLTSTDFAVTDLAIDMLYLVEAKSAAMEASRTLNRRLQGAMREAEHRAITDTLTGLQNRRAMDHTLQRLLRNEERFAVLHVDLDFFKQVNDTRGHAAGDQVLQAVARIMLDLTRKDDIVARVGGDEFVILLVGLVDRHRLSVLAERLISRIEQPIPIDGSDCIISASIGISVHLPDVAGAQAGNQLLEQSDEALYLAKRSGRAQHAFYEPWELRKAT